MSEAGSKALQTHAGGCHCRAVRFEVDAPARLEVTRCNCSICSMTDYLHLIVPRSRFRLLQGQAQLTSYRFNTGTAEHLFCRVCGIKSFYVPRSHPDGFSINARCIDRQTIEAVEIVHEFDGVHWERHVASLPPLPE